MTSMKGWIDTAIRAAALAVLAAIWWQSLALRDDLDQLGSEVILIEAMLDDFCVTTRKCNPL